jgi:predicted CopG family antitoxin
VSRTIRVSRDVYERLQELRLPGERNFNGAILRALGRGWGGVAPAGKLVADYERERAEH